jgi:DNA helicase HerA-like ATPase
MEWARRNRRARKVLVVLEEAHTIIPETAGAGFDYDTQWVVGRISQIALQGRKYGVGLLIVSQRTALVSKSILSQCNTCITFSLVDKTSLDYLGNVYSLAHIQSIPNLRFLEAVAYGKGIRSERPLVIRLEYVQAKKDACDALNKICSSEKKDESGNA